MKKFIVASALVGSAVLLAGCDDSGTGGGSSEPVQYDEPGMYMHINPSNGKFSVSPFPFSFSSPGSISIPM